MKECCCITFVILTMLAIAGTLSLDALYKKIIDKDTCFVDSSLVTQTKPAEYDLDVRFHTKRINDRVYYRDQTLVYPRRETAYHDQAHVYYVGANVTCFIRKDFEYKIFAPQNANDRISLKHSTLEFIKLSTMIIISSIFFLIALICICIVIM